MLSNNPNTNPDLDSKDRQILNLLQKDADITIEALAETVGLSRNACWRRVKMLEEKGIILKKVVLLDAEKIGLGQTVFIVVRTNEHDVKWLKKFAEVIRQTPEILGAYRMSGDLDYLLKVCVRDVKAYDIFYQRLISKIPLTDVSASFVMEDIKDTTEFMVT